MVIVAETVIGRSTAITSDEAKAVVKETTNEMILAQDNVIYLTNEKDVESEVYTLRNEIGATKIQLVNKGIGKIMFALQGYMREQCHHIADLSQNRSVEFLDCYRSEFVDELPSQASKWNDKWTAYVDCWDNYRNCCISELGVLKQMNDERSDKLLVIILGISVPVFLILIASLILYFIMRSRYRIVRRSFRLKSLSAKRAAPGTEPTGVEGIACGSQKKGQGPSTNTVDYTADEEEDPLYDDMCLKEPPILDQSNVYNTIAHKDQPVEEEGEERLYSVVTKSCSTKPAAPEEGREIEDQELLKTSIEEILVEEYSTIDKEKLESSKAAATDDGAEGSYTVLNRSSKSPEKDLETGAINTLMIKRPPKERPISKRYSCNLDLNQTLINQPARNMMTTVLLETDTGLDCDTTDGHALIEKEGDGDQMN